MNEGKSARVTSDRGSGVALRPPHRRPHLKKLRRRAQAVTPAPTRQVLALIRVAAPAAAGRAVIPAATAALALLPLTHYHPAVRKKAAVFTLMTHGTEVGAVAVAIQVAVPQIAIQEVGVERGRRPRATVRSHSVWAAHEGCSEEN